MRVKSQCINRDLSYIGPHLSRGFYHAVHFAQNVLLKTFKKPRILVVGYGPGYELVYLIKGGIEAIGLELNIPNLDIIKSNTVVASAEFVPFFDKSFDFVFCCETFEHIPLDTCGEILKEFKRISNNYYLTIATRGDPPWNTHINIRNGEDWIKDLRNMGFGVRHAAIAPFCQVKYSDCILTMDYPDGVVIYGNC